MRTSSRGVHWRRLHRSWRRLEGSPEDVPVVTGFNFSQRCEDVFKKSSMKTSSRRLHRSWRRLEYSPEDVPLVNGFDCSQRCEDVFKKSSMKTSWRRLQILHLPTGAVSTAEHISRMNMIHMVGGGGGAQGYRYPISHIPDFWAPYPRLLPPNIPYPRFYSQFSVSQVLQAANVYAQCTYNRLQKLNFDGIVINCFLLVEPRSGSETIVLRLSVCVSVRPRWL